MMNIKLKAVFKSREKDGEKNKNKNEAHVDMRSTVEKKAHNFLVRCPN